MLPHRKRLQEMVENQVLKWQMGRKSVEAANQKQIQFDPVITISRLPGSNTEKIVEALSEKLGFEVFDARLVELLAKDAKLSAAMVESLDEKNVSKMDEWMKGFTSGRYLGPEEFIGRLVRIISSIGSQGRGIIVGRGAGLMLPPEKCLRVLLVAPLEARIVNLAKQLKIPQEQARLRIIQKEADSKAYIRKYFKVEMTDPLLYDLVVNTAGLKTAVVAELIMTAWGDKKSRSSKRAIKGRVGY